MVKQTQIDNIEKNQNCFGVFCLHLALLLNKEINTDFDANMFSQSQCVCVYQSVAS